jgi:ankyrin repeat protein
LPEIERVRLFHNAFKANTGSKYIARVDFLYITAVNGYKSLLKSLHENGADVNAQGGLFGTALQAAAEKGDEEIVAILLEKGADIL